MATVAATALARSTSLSRAATAASATEAATKDVDIDPANRTPAHLAKNSIRLPKLDTQSTQDLFSNVGSWRRDASPELGARLEALAASRNVNPAELPMDAAGQLAMTHPSYAARARLNTSTQQLTSRGIADAYHKDSQAWLAALAARTSAGRVRWS